MFPGLFYKKWEEAEYTQKLGSEENTQESTFWMLPICPTDHCSPYSAPTGRPAQTPIMGSLLSALLLVRGTGQSPDGGGTSCLEYLFFQNLFLEEPHLQ